MKTNRSVIILILLLLVFAATMIVGAIDIRKSKILFQEISSLRATGVSAEIVEEAEREYRSFMVLRVSSAGLVAEILIVVLGLVTYAGPQLHKQHPVTQAEAKILAKQIKKEYKIEGQYAEAQNMDEEIGEDKSQITSLDTPVLVSAKYVNGRVIVRWKKVPHAEYYLVFRMSGTDGFRRIGKIMSTEKMIYEDYNITSRTTYTYTVRAYMDVDETQIFSKYDPNGVSSYVFQGNIPDVPKIFEAIYEEGNVGIGWEPVQGAKFYYVMMKTEEGKWVGREKVLGTENCVYVDPNVLPGEKHCYSVRACRTIRGNRIYGSYNLDGIEVVCNRKE